ncbi:MAG: hypothetical protein ACYTAF_09645 [Planctomycetota bacterium]|jgi:hypothetical protein
MASRSTHVYRGLLLAGLALLLTGTALLQGCETTRVSSSGLIAEKGYYFQAHNNNTLWAYIKAESPVPVVLAAHEALVSMGAKLKPLSKADLEARAKKAKETNKEDDFHLMEEDTKGEYWVIIWYKPFNKIPADRIHLSIMDRKTMSMNVTMELMDRIFTNLKHERRQSGDVHYFELK